MRPLRLRMVAFGPFAEEQVIDFERLGSAALFLIDGPTGAGKTTILDAICYALYDRSTGGERDARQMRSDFARADVLTEVELLFSLGESRYRVRRIPEQLRPRQRGDGTTKQSSVAELYRLDGDEETVLVARKVGDANAEIARLTGLTVEQFRQVMVLPQGQFRKLLTAESKERQAILQSLFGTELYARVVERLKSLSGGLAQQDRELEVKLEATWRAVGLAPDAELDRELAVMQDQLERQLAARREAEQAMQLSVKALSEAEQLAAAIDSLAELDVQLDTLRATLPEQRAREAALLTLSAVEGLVPGFEKLQDATRTAKQGKDDLVDLEQAFAASGQQLEAAEREHESASIRFQRREGILRSLHDLATRIPQLDALDSAKRDVMQAEAELARVAATRDSADSAVVGVLQQLKTVQSQLSTAEVGAAKVPGMRYELEEKNRVAALMSESAEIEQALNTCERELHLAVDALSVSEQSLLRAAQLRAQGEQLWQRQQALALSASLAEGVACPVCGSEEHPAPASHQPDLLDFEAVGLDALREEERLSATHKNELVTQRQQIEMRITALRERRAAVGKSLDGVSADPDTTLEQRLAQAERDATSLEELRRSVARLDQERIAHETELRDAEASRNAAVQRHTTAVATVAQLRAQFAEDVPSREALVAQRAELELERDQLETDHRRSQHVLEQARLSVAQSNTRVEVARTAYQKAERERDAHQASWYRVLSDSPFEDDVEFAAALQLLPQRSSLEEQVASFHERLRQLEANRKAQARQVAERPTPDLNTLQGQVESRRGAFESASASCAESEARLEQLQKTAQTIRALSAEQDAVAARFRVTGGLSQVAAGQNPLKLNFQSFVLSVLLDDVLLAAGERLQRMTRGRYRLVRREGVTHGGRQAGLDLDVEDAHTGRQRHADTLSGGESFLAALALALGLSDVVQAHAGGIRLDTLFIDEGFGSLDPEALDLAVSTLVDLQASGRLIGVISHVPELREQIQSRLQVRAGATGSRATLTVNPGVDPVH